MACVRSLAMASEAAPIKGMGALVLRFLSLLPPVIILHRDRKMRKPSVSSTSAGRCWRRAQSLSSWPQRRRSWSSPSTRVTRRKERLVGKSAAPPPTARHGVLSSQGTDRENASHLPFSPSQAAPQGTGNDGGWPCLSTGRGYFQTLGGICISTLHPERHGPAVPGPRPPARI